MIYKFKVGDIIVSKNGFRPKKVLELTQAQWDYCLLEDIENKKKSYVMLLTINENYYLYSDENSTVMPTVSTLYSFYKPDGSIAYGNHIGTNSQNKYLIEEKGTGEIHVVDKEKLEEVLPYTFSVRYNGTSKEYHFIGEPDTVNKKDILIQFPSESNQHFTLVEVVNVDTKCRSANKRFNGVKVMTQPI